MEFIKNKKNIMKGFLHLFKSRSLIEPLSDEKIKSHYGKEIRECKMKFHNKWIRNWYSQILVLMAITAGIGFVVVLYGYALIGQIIIWSAVGVDCVAVIVRWKTRNE